MPGLLDPLREDVPLPPSEVDIGRAVLVGRRRLRARWSAAAVFVLVVAVLVPVLGRVGGDRPDPVAGPAPASRDFDPLRQVVTLADLPGVTPAAIRTARRWQHLQLDVGAHATGRVTVYAPGRSATDSAGPVRPTTGSPAEPVGGRAAYWVEWPTGEALAWRWADDAWAFAALQRAGTDRAADRATLREIAAAVRVGAGQPVALPFTLPLPPTHQVVGTRTRLRPAGDPAARAELLLDTGDPTDPDQHRPDAIVVAATDDPAHRESARANRVVAGHPALVTPEEVIVFGLADDFLVDVTGPEDADLVALARTVRLVPTPGDRSAWTHHPIR